MTGLRLVAVLDILGFKKKVMSTPLEELSKEYEGIVEATNVFNHPISSYSVKEPEGIDKAFSEPLCHKHIFSDTFILVSLADDDLSGIKLLIYTWKITQAMISRGVPVRGGIAFGEYYEDPVKSIHIGKALTTASELEKRQDWIGVSMDHGVKSAYPRFFEYVDSSAHILHEVFPKYPVPVKGGPTEEFYTLNWRWNLVVQEGTRSLFSRDGDPDAERKIDNTLEYARVVVSRGKTYPQDQGLLPLALKTMWVGKKEPPFKHGDEL